MTHTLAAAVHFAPATVYCIIAVIVLGVSKTGFGGGGIGILSVPLMAMAMPANEMLGVLAILLVVVDLLSNLHYLGQYDWPVLRWLLPGAGVGGVFGCVILLKMRGDANASTAAAATASDSFNRKLSLTIGLLCLIFVLAQVVRLFGGELPTPPS